MRDRGPGGQFFLSLMYLFLLFSVCLFLSLPSSVSPAWFFPGCFSGGAVYTFFVSVVCPVHLGSSPARDAHVCKFSERKSAGRTSTE